MPYQSIPAAKSGGFMTTISGANLTLAQINHLARIYDALKAGGKDNSMAMAIAIGQFKEIYKKEGDAWVEKEKMSEDKNIEEQPSGAGMDDVETETILNKEIMAVGKWNGYPFTEKTLDELVKNSQILKNRFDIPLKLGHPDEQSIEIYKKNGEKWVLKNAEPPAYGFFTNLRRVGKKLIADIERVPTAVAKWIRSGNYHDVSVELVKGYVDNGLKKTFDLVLSAVALLGSSHKAVTDLTPFMPLSMKKGEFEMAYFAVMPTNPSAGNWRILDGDGKEVFNSETEVLEDMEGKEIMEKLSEMAGKIEKIELAFPLAPVAGQPTPMEILTQKVDALVTRVAAIEAAKAPAKMSDEEVAAKEKADAEAAKGEDPKVAELKAETEKLSAEKKDLADKVIKLSRDAKKLEIGKFFDEAIAKGTFLQKDKDIAVLVLSQIEDSTLKFSEEGKEKEEKFSDLIKRISVFPRVDFAERSGKGDPILADAEAKLTAAVEKLRKENPTMKYSDALAQASQIVPEYKS